MQKLYMVAEVAELLRVDPQTVRRWLRDGRLSGIKTEHEWRIQESDIQAWIERNQRKATRGKAA